MGQSRRFWAKRIEDTSLVFCIRKKVRYMVWGNQVTSEYGYHTTLLDGCVLYNVIDQVSQRVMNSFDFKSNETAVINFGNVRFLS